MYRRNWQNIVKQLYSNQNFKKKKGEMDTVVAEKKKIVEELKKKKKKWFVCIVIKRCLGTSLVVYWLRLRALDAGGLDLIPGQGTRFHIPQLKIPRAVTKTQCSPIKK